jgi:hypothetical protein
MCTDYWVQRNHQTGCTQPIPKRDGNPLNQAHPPLDFITNYIKILNGPDTIAKRITLTNHFLIGGRWNNKQITPKLSPQHAKTFTMYAHLKKLLLEMGVKAIDLEQHKTMLPYTNPQKEIEDMANKHTTPDLHPPDHRPEYIITQPHSHTRPHKTNTKPYTHLCFHRWNPNQQQQHKNSRIKHNPLNKRT